MGFTNEYDYWRYQSQPKDHFGADKSHTVLQNQLARSIAQRATRACWSEIEYIDGRPDVISMDVSGKKFTDPHIYEVKVTRADFASDIRSGKWRKYLPNSAQFSFATPLGLIVKSEIPPDAGWLELKRDGSWVRRKRSPKRDCEVPCSFVIKCALYRHPITRVGRAWEAREYLKHLERKSEVGRQAANYISQKDWCDAQILSLKSKVKEQEAILLGLKAANKHSDFATSDLFPEPEDVTTNEASCEPNE